MNHTTILEDSPNGFPIVHNAPRVNFEKGHGVEDAIRYYLKEMVKYNRLDRPVEYALINYNVGKIFLADKKREGLLRSAGDRAKRIENGLFHFHESLQVFTQKDYPAQFVLICVFMAQLFRERTDIMMDGRSYLVKNGQSTPEESIQYGIDQLLQAMPIFTTLNAQLDEKRKGAAAAAVSLVSSSPRSGQTGVHAGMMDVEHSICCLETGWLYMIQSEFMANVKDDSIREHAVIYLEKAIDLCHNAAKTASKKDIRSGHVKILCQGFSPILGYIEGSALYMLGRVYQGWGDYTHTMFMNIDGMDPARSLKDNLLKENQQIIYKRRAFDNYCKSIRPKLLPLNCILWAEAHHRAATTVIKYPAIMDADYENAADIGSKGSGSDLHIQAAISHLALSLRCTVLTNHYKMDLHFHLSQAYIARLQTVIDKIPKDESVIKALSGNPDAMDLIAKIERHLNEALIRVTAASNETIQDGYLYYYACLKMAEFKMLAAACNEDLHELEREDNLKESITYVIDTLTSRSMEECLDLHYLSVAQLAQILGSVKRYYTAARTYSKALLTLSAVVNRAFYSPESLNAQFRDEVFKHLSQALHSSERQLSWVKWHLGPVRLNERGIPGYSSWSFEEAKSMRRKPLADALQTKKKGESAASKPPALSAKNIFLGFSSKKGGDDSAGTPSPEPGTIKSPSQIDLALIPTNGSTFVQPSPPKGIPPHLHIQSKAMKVNLTGSQIFPDASPGPQLPSGPVPLAALGHNPMLEEIEDAEPDEEDDGEDGEECNQDIIYPGPYGRRRRRRVPPAKSMLEYDQANQSSYLNVKSSKPSYLPSFGNKKDTGYAVGKDGQPSNDEGDPSVAKARRLPHPAAEWSLNKFKAQKSADDEDDFDEDEYGNYDDDDENEGDGGDEGEMDNDGDIEMANEMDSDEDEFRGRRNGPNPSANKQKAITDNDNDDVSELENSSESEEESLSEKKEKKKSALFGLASLALGGGGDKKSQKKSKRLTFADDGGDAPQKGKGEWVNKGGLLVRMFRKLVKKRNKSAVAAMERKKRSLGFFRNPFAPVVTPSKTQEEYGMWASNNAYFTFMIMSRASRLDTVLLSQVLDIPDGERANYSFYSSSSQQQMVLKTYYMCRKFLYKNCQKLIPLAFTLKELNQRSYLELSKIFEAQDDIFRILNELEKALCEGLNKVEFFLPIVNVAPVLTTRRQLFDEFVLDSKRLTSTLYNEYALIHRKIHAQRAKVQRILAGKPNTILANTVANAVSEGNTGSGQSAYAKPTQPQRVSISNMSVGSENSQETSQSQLKEEFDKSRKSLMSALTFIQKKQVDEEKEEVLLGKMTYSLSSVLDGTGMKGGARDMLLQHLALDECLMLWHMPHRTYGNQKVQVLLVWRDNSASRFAYYSSSEAIIASELKAKIGKRKKKPPTADAKKMRKKGIIMEVAKCDCDGATLSSLLQNYLNALHEHVAPIRLTRVTDSLRSLSCALSISELLVMVPPQIRSFVICCPHSMRAIPWHLLLIEVPVKIFSPSNVEGGTENGSSSPQSIGRESRSLPTKEAVTEIHWCEKAVIRLGPNLTLFELCAVSASKLKQSIGLHRMCAIDGEADGHRSPGVRGTDLEVACVTSTFTTDPADRHILMHDAAVPARLQTGIGSVREEKLYKAFKEDVFIRREEKVNHLKVAGIPSKDEYGDMADDDSVVLGNSAFNDRKETDKKAADNEDDDDDGEQTEAEQLRMEENMYALSMCRVLHIGASKVARNKNESSFASVKLPSKSKCKELKLLGKVGNEPTEKKKPEKRKRTNYLTEEEEQAQHEKEKRKEKELKRDTLDSADIIKQLYVKNCALCILSRFGLTDDVFESDKLETNTQFLESFHIAGANSIIYPLWAAHGIGRLANLLILIRFYSVLSNNSKDRVSIAETLRQSQLWLRNITADDAIRFIQKASIPQKAREVIIEEMESYVKASLTKDVSFTVASPNAATDSRFVSIQSPKSLPKDMPDFTAGNRIGGNRKFFTHFHYWGAFAISGQGGGVHHPNLTEDKDDGDGEEEVLNEKDLRKIGFEAQILRMEGKIEEAMVLEGYIRKKRLDRFKYGINAVRNTGIRAGRGFMDTVDFLDKKLLDQDSDSVSLSESSDEDDDDDSWGGEGDDDDDEDEEDEEDDDEASASESREAESPSERMNRMQRKAKAKKKKKKKKQAKKKRRFKPTSIELSSLLKTEDAEYDKWRAKIGQLESKVVPVDRIVEVMKQKHVAALQSQRSFNGNSVTSAEKQKHENFEYHLQTQISTMEAGGALDTHKLVKEKMTLGNSKNAGKKAGRANYLGDEVQDEENGDEKVSNYSDESDDVDVKTKIFREIRSEVRTYREAAKALMHPIEMLDKETRKRFQRSKKDFNGAAVINSNAYNNGDDEEQSSSPGSGVIRQKGKGRSPQDGENCSLS